MARPAEVISAEEMKLRYEAFQSGKTYRELGKMFYMTDAGFYYYVKKMGWRRNTLNKRHSLSKSVWEKRHRDYLDGKSRDELSKIWGINPESVSYEVWMNGWFKELQEVKLNEGK